MYFLKKLSVIFLLSLSLVGCGSESQKEQKGKLVASVHQYQLFEQELRAQLPNNLSKIDSTDFANSYLQKWIRKMLRLHQSEKLLSKKSQEALQDKIEQYRQDLLIHAYETEYLYTKLDKQIVQNQIDSFYTANQKDFLLKAPIMKVMWIKTPPAEAQKANLKALLLSANQEDSNQIKDYCAKFAIDYKLEDNNWQTFETILQQSGWHSEENAQQFLQKNALFEQNEGNQLTYLLIKDFKEEGTEAPISFVKKDIELLILNERKTQLIQTLEKKLLKEAQKQKSYKVYE